MTKIKGNDNKNILHKINNTKQYLLKLLGNRKNNHESTNLLMYIIYTLILELIYILNWLFSQILLIIY